MLLKTRRHDEAPPIPDGESTAVDLAPLPLPLGAPARSVGALAELRAATAEPEPAEQIRRAIGRATATLHLLLAAPDPRTDWADAYARCWNGAFAEIERVVFDATRRLDQIQNSTLFALQMQYAPIAELAEVAS